MSEGDSGVMLLMCEVSSSTMHVNAAAAQPPNFVMALMSACTPALPSGSLPAIRNTFPVNFFSIYLIILVVSRTGPP